MMKVKAAKCKKCFDIIYSRANHDMHWCSCHSVAVDGGQGEGSYLRTCGNDEDYDTLDIEVDVTLGELYRDWNETPEGEEGKFGWIHKSDINLES